MSANGAHLGCLLANYDVTAVSALPNLNFALLEYFLSLNVLKESSVSLFVMLLDSADHSELSCECREALCFSSLGEIFVHVCPLVVLAVSSCCEVLCCCADALELLEPHLSVLLLVISCLEEERCDLLVAFLLSLGCEIGVLISCLGLACECSLKVLLCLCACVLAHF